jgi:predicted metal-binding membrane protein
VAVAAEASGRGQALHHDALAEGGLPPWAVLGLFLLAWQLMIAAMMLPSSLPLVRLFSRVAANQPRPMRAMTAFLGGYAAVWTGFGVIAFLGDMGIHRLVGHWEWLAARPSLIGGAVLLLAGGFQFSSLKERCLRVCRHPGGYLLQHYRRGTSAAFRLGAGHGVFCVGCCWALMLVAFAAGVARLWWMAALTAVMVFEKTGRGGQRGVRPIGLGLAVLGILMLAQAL